MTGRILQNRLRIRRLELDPPLQQKDLAALLGIAPSLLSAYENGIPPRSLRRVFELAVLLRMPVEQLFHELYLDVSNELACRIPS